MYVYVVMAHYDYEGYSLPYLITASKKQALEFKLPKYCGGGSKEVYAYVIGKEEDGLSADAVTE